MCRWFVALLLLGEVLWALPRAPSAACCPELAPAQLVASDPRPKRLFEGTDKALLLVLVLGAAMLAIGLTLLVVAGGSPEGILVGVVVGVLLLGLVLLLFWKRGWRKRPPPGPPVIPPGHLKPKPIPPGHLKPRPGPPPGRVKPRHSQP